MGRGEVGFPALSSSHFCSSYKAEGKHEDALLNRRTGDENTNLYSQAKGRESGAGNVVEFVEHLPPMHEALGSIPSITQRRC